MGIHGAVAVTVLVSAGLAQAAPDAEHATANLRQIRRQLNDSVRSFYAHLGQEIDRHDRGYRGTGRTQVPGADIDLSIGPADLMSSATQKFTAFRMLAARDESYAPQAAADLERIEQLIPEARRRVDAGTAVLRRMMLVPAAQLGRSEESATKLRRDQLFKARAGAEEAAQEALLAFPLDQEQAFDKEQPGAQDETAAHIWSTLTTAKTPAFPLRIEPHRRMTLIREAAYRFAVTDSGMEDSAGRHVFYQEEWVQRGPAVIRLRWRVGVETATGAHVLLKRYSPVELHGDLDELYNRRDRYYLWYLEPEEDTAEPTHAELEAALAGVTRAREAVRTAANDFRHGVREALAQQGGLDSGLPDDMRQRLFAIRAHIARVPGILQLENAVRASVSKAEAAIRDLEPLAAWLNEPGQRVEKTPLIDRSDIAIDAVRSAETEALRTLPPDMARDAESFPAMERNMIVRMRRAPSRNPQNNAVKCVQEIWRMETGTLGNREVTRTVSLIVIDPKTGSQMHVGTATRYYKAAPEELLEEVYDEYAADDVVVGI
jgi:hypothetical protein